MPNWCFNRLRISGPTDDVVQFQQQAVGFSPWYHPEPHDEEDRLSFHNLVPIPSEILAAGFEPVGAAWERQHWGCHGGAERSATTQEWHGGALYEFDTAGSPPLNFLQAVSRSWPTLVFVLAYEERGNAYQGLARAKAGAMENYRVALV